MTRLVLAGTILRESGHRRRDRADDHNDGTGRSEFVCVMILTTEDP